MATRSNSRKPPISFLGLVIMVDAAALVIQALILLSYWCTDELDMDGFIMSQITMFLVLAFCTSRLERNRRLSLEHLQPFGTTRAVVQVQDEVQDEYCPLYTLVANNGQCRCYGFCFRIQNWVKLPFVPQSRSRRSVMLPVASAGGLLVYTKDANSSEDVLLFNPTTGESRILGPNNEEMHEEQAAGQDFRMVENDHGEFEFEFRVYESEEETDDDIGRNSRQSRLIHVLMEPGTETLNQIIMSGRALGSVRNAANGEDHKAEMKTEVYDNRGDTWTTVGDLCGGLRLVRNSSSADYNDLVFTVEYGPDQAGNPYFLSAFHRGLGTWSRYTRLVFPAGSVEYEEPQIVGCDDGRIFLVTLYVWRTIRRALEEGDDMGETYEFSHQVTIYQFAPVTLECTRLPDTFTHISSKQQNDLEKVDYSNGKICIGLNRRALVYYDLREKKWHEYPELDLGSDEDNDAEDEEIRYSGICYRPSFTARVW